MAGKAELKVIENEINYPIMDKVKSVKLSKTGIYWNPDKILSYNCCFNIVESQRGGGKTVGILNYCLNNFIKRDQQFIYFRRYEKDLELVRKVMFDDLVSLGVREAENVRVDGRYIIYNDMGMDKNNRFDTSHDRVMGICISFADFSRLKSMPLPKAKTFIFEEYIPEDGRYIANEMFKLMGMYESIDRSRDRLNMFLLGNHISDNNPYYEFFGVTPQKDSRFTHIKSKSCVIERYYSEGIVDKRAKTRFGSLISDTQYGAFIDGKGTMDDARFVERINEPNMKELFNLNGHGVFERQNEDIYIRTRKNSGPNYVLSPDGAGSGVIATKKLLSMIAMQIRFGTLRFETLALKFELYEDILKTMKK